MRKRKRDLIMACRSLRQQILESDEAGQVSDAGICQRKLLEIQLQQVLGEYGQAQEYLEMARLNRHTKETGIEPPPRSREVRIGNLSLSAGAACWQSNKDVQEDRFILDIEFKTPSGHIVTGVAVMDGHSGSLCVDHLVDNLPGNLQRAVCSKDQISDTDMKAAVYEACAKTDEDFLRKARQMQVLDGSTLILTLIYPKLDVPGADGKSFRLLTACVGDSRAVLCRAASADAEGQLLAVPLSDDHKPNREDEKLRVERKGGLVDFEGVWRVFVPGPCSFGGQMIQRWGLAVSRAFGDLLLKEPERFDCAGVAPGGLIISTPEINIVDLDPDLDRFVVLASDGVWDVISSQDAISICAAQADAELAAQTLLRRTYAANSDDNITAVVLTWKAD